MKWTLFRWFQYFKKQWIHCGGLAENMYLLTLYIYPFLISLVIWNVVSYYFMHFSEDVQKNSCFENFRRFPEKCICKVLLKQFQLWIHHLYIYWKLTPSQMFVSVSRIFKIAIRVSCGETNSKVAWEFFAFYNFAKYSIVLLLVCFKK